MEKYRKIWIIKTPNKETFHVVIADPFRANVLVYLNSFCYFSVLAAEPWEPLKYRSNRLEVFCKKGFFKNFMKLTGRQLCRSLFFNKVAGLIFEQI